MAARQNANVRAHICVRLHVHIRSCVAWRNLFRGYSVAMRFLFIIVFVAVQTSLARDSRAEERQNYFGTFTDSRDGKTYKTVMIANQIWMAENLGYDVGKGSYCYDDDLKNCSKYGRLYTFEAAKRAVPHGWHLPSKSDFERLLTELGGPGTPAYAKLIEGGSSQFNVLFGGSHNAFESGRAVKRLILAHFQARRAAQRGR
jgi:hypothetical protein